MTTCTPNGHTLIHADHGLTEAHLRFIDELLVDFSGEFTMLHRTLPADCPNLLSAIYGPSVGDSPVNESLVHYEVRNGRPGPSRLIARPERWCRNMVLIAVGNRGPTVQAVGGGGILRVPAVILTSYGTQGDTIAPREWWDAGMKPHETVEAAQFWTDHALADGSVSPVEGPPGHILVGMTMNGHN